MNKAGQVAWRLARTLLGLTAGAAITSAVVAVLDPYPTNSQLPVEIFIDGVINSTFFVLLFAFPVGLSGHAVLYALKRRQFIYYAGLGAAGGGAFALATYLLDRNIDTLVFARNALTFTIWAGACAAIAWFIRRPDKDDLKLPDPATHF